jgi:hypothetical protein
MARFSQPRSAFGPEALAALHALNTRNLSRPSRVRLENLSASSKQRFASANGTSAMCQDSLVEEMDE